MDDALFKIMSWVDTASICSAIRIATGNKSAVKFTHCNVLCANADGLPVVGYARTARYTAPKELGDQEAMLEKRMAYYQYVADGPSPSILVMQDADHPQHKAALWGEVEAHIHRKLGIRGVVTNGVIRDLENLPDSFPMLGGSISPFPLGFGVTDFNVPVEVFGQTVEPGDMIHADRHGMAVLPEKTLPLIQEGVVQLFTQKRIVMDQLEKPDFDLDRLKTALRKTDL